MSTISPAAVILIPGLVILSIIGTYSTISYIKHKSDFYRGVIKRILIVSGLGILFLTIPKEFQIEILYKGHPEFIEAYKNALNNPDNEELWDKFYKENDKLQK